MSYRTNVSIAAVRPLNHPRSTCWAVPNTACFLQIDKLHPVATESAILTEVSRGKGPDVTGW